MKKFFFCLLALTVALSSKADGSPATITSAPSPAVTTKALEVTIKTDNFGSTVYCYTWCKEINGSEKTPSWEWASVHTDKFKMSGNNGTYTFKISDLKRFYELSDTELSGLTKLGFIAKTSDGKQTADLLIDVVQGRVNAYSGGEGTEASPFILKTSADLAELSTTPMDWASDVYLRLESDIDAAALTNSIGSKSSPFKGTFDGAGHSIKNLRLTNSNIGESAGLFGALDGAKVSDLGVISANVSGQTYVGILAGYAVNSTISRCFTSGTVEGVSICVGGLVGENAGTITDCYSSATVCNDDDYATGGLVGKNTGNITNTYASGEVSGKDYVGGIVGANYGNVKASFALNGRITSHNDFAARFGGNNNSQNITESNYSWEKMPTGHTAWTAHGDHATQRAASELANSTTFQQLSGWNFSSVWEWRNENGKEYPALRNLANQTTPLSESFYDAATGIDDINSDGVYLAVGPNPTNGILYVNSSEALSECRLFNMNGSLAAYADAAMQQSAELDLGSLAPSMYILRVTTATGAVSVHKVIRK